MCAFTCVYVLVCVCSMCMCVFVFLYFYCACICVCTCMCLLITENILQNTSNSCYNTLKKNCFLNNNIISIIKKEVGLKWENKMMIEVV